ncbi:MAG: ComEA family DNA-binding protein [Actinomycetota bacterium]|jgi:competence protein ComEA
MDNEYFEKVSNWWSELHYSSLQKRGLAIIAGLVVLISALFVMRGSSQEVVAAPAPLEITDIALQTLMVDVAGAVVNPGVYSLPLNSRVVEAIKAAGGLKKGADTSDINQARILKDGEQIYVYPAATAFSRSTGTPVRKNGPIMINRATAKDFESLDGIGPVLANRIVTYRKSNGPFTAVEDLLKVQGIGQSKFAQFKEKLRV